MWLGRLLGSTLGQVGRVLAFPLHVWTLEVVQDTLLKSALGHNPAWDYSYRCVGVGVCVGGGGGGDVCVWGVRVRPNADLTSL